MKFGDLKEMSKRSRKEPPLKDIELALREVLDEYQNLAKQKRVAALEKMIDLIEDEDDQGEAETQDPASKEADNADDSPAAS